MTCGGAGLLISDPRSPEIDHQTNIWPSSSTFSIRAKMASTVEEVEINQLNLLLWTRITTNDNINYEGKRKECFGFQILFTLLKAHATFPQTVQPLKTPELPTSTFDLEGTSRSCAPTSSEPFFVRKKENSVGRFCGWMAEEHILCYWSCRGGLKVFGLHGD